MVTYMRTFYVIKLEGATTEWSGIAKCAINTTRSKKCPRNPDGLSCTLSSGITLAHVCNHKIDQSYCGLDLKKALFHLTKQYRN